MLGPRHPSLGSAVSIHPSRLWRRGVVVVAVASSAVAATAALSSAWRLAAVGDHARALPFALQGALAAALATVVVLAVALRSLERVVVYERGLVLRRPWRAREVRFEEVLHVEWARDPLGEHVELALAGGRELRLTSVADAQRLASLVRTACARRSPGLSRRALV